MEGLRSDSVISPRTTCVSDFSPGALMPLTFCPVEPQVFQQKLDVSGVWFARNNWPVLIHSELDESIQNCAVFVIILKKKNHLKYFIYKLLFPQQTGRRHRVSNQSRFPCCAGRYMDCSNQFATQLQQSSCSQSRLTQEPHLASRGVFEEVVQPCQGCVLLRQSLFTDSWWMAIQHEQLDVHFPRHVVVYKSEGHT